MAQAVYALDVSNYTTGDDAGTLASLRDGAGLRLLLPQAVDPPSPYPPTRTRRQCQAGIDAGIALAPYLWLWWNVSLDDLRRKLDLLTPFAGQIQRLWLDVEDTTGGALARSGVIGAPPRPLQAVQRFRRQAPPHETLRLSGPLTLSAREDQLLAALELLASFPTVLGTPGIYTGGWYWPVYMGNSTAFAGHPLWAAQYDYVQDLSAVTMFGGWTAPVRIKQYAGTVSTGTLHNVDFNIADVDETIAAAAPMPLVGVGVNVDPLNPDGGSPDPATLRSYWRQNWVRLVSRRGCEGYVAQARSAGLDVLAASTEASGGYLLADATCWQIGNEPDQAGEASDTMTPEAYASHLKVYRGSYPRSMPMIAAGLASGQPGYLDAVLEADPSALDGYSAIAVHPYAKDPAAAADLIGQYQRFGLPIVVTEWNRPADQIADWLAQVGSIVPALAWYGYSEGMKQGFGLVNVDGTLTDAGRAMQDALAPDTSEQQIADLQKEVGGLGTALAYVCDSLGDQIWAATRSTAVRTAVTEMRRVRSQFIGPRPS